MRLGIDLGGTKIEIVALDEGGAEVLRRRVATPRGSYRGIVEAIVELTHAAEAELATMGHVGPHSLGVGIPGSISPRTGLAMNANSTELNGKPLDKDVSALLAREVRFANDANCLAVSEAVDGAGASGRLVFGVIIGTGFGAGIAIDGKVWNGHNHVGGEWGHSPLSGATIAELQQAETCWCGRFNCSELWVSGTGFERDFSRGSGRSLRGHEIVAEALAGPGEAADALERYVSRFARHMAQMINILDPDVIVLGGGMSKVSALYEMLPAALAPLVCSDHFDTPIRPAKHGDSSGVRGAAWLWEK